MCAWPVSVLFNMLRIWIKGQFRKKCGCEKQPVHITSYNEDSGDF